MGTNQLLALTEEQQFQLVATVAKPLHAALEMTMKLKFT